MFAGIGLIVLGVTLAFRQAGFIPWLHMGAVWPLVMVIFGFRMIFRYWDGNHAPNTNAKVG